MNSKRQKTAMSKISTDRLPPVSFDVGVSIKQSSSDKQREERKRDRKPMPKDNDLEISDEPKHQIDDQA